MQNRTKSWKPFGTAAYTKFIKNRLQNAEKSLGTLWCSRDSPSRVSNRFRIKKPTASLRKPWVWLECFVFSRLRYINSEIRGGRLHKHLRPKSPWLTTLDSRKPKAQENQFKAESLGTMARLDKYLPAHLFVYRPSCLCYSERGWSDYRELYKGVCQP